MINEARRMAKKICKRLEPQIAVAITARPKEGGGYTTLQGYRTALALAAAACLEHGLAEDEVHGAVQAAMDGFKAQQKGLER